MSLFWLMLLRQGQRGHAVVVRVPTTSTSNIRRAIHSSALTIHDNVPASATSSNSASASTSISSHSQPPKKETLKFGKVFSPHMLTISYSNHEWQDPKIVPYGPLSISPGSACLNYGMTCFEGMKAYRSLGSGSDGSNGNSGSSDGSGNGNGNGGDDILLFRPDKNMERLSNSMKRLSLPGYDFDREQLIRCIMKLVHLDQAWIPEGEGYSLYLRPNVIAMNENLGLSHPESLLLYVVTSPVGPYYHSSGFQPIRLWCESNYVRAYRGGTGNCKVGGNYAPTMKPAKEAMERGYSQVLWLSSWSQSQSQSQSQSEKKDELFVTEVGAMNIFFVLDHRRRRRRGGRNKNNDEKDDGILEIVTPPLHRGDILPGVTRQSIIELVGEWNQKETTYEMVERDISMKEIQQAVQDGILVEAFGAGTAAVVTPIECIHYNGIDLKIPATGKVTQRVWDELTKIQYGKVKDHPWSVRVVGV